jgi:hypothetical protein
VVTLTESEEKAKQTRATRETELNLTLLDESIGIAQKEYIEPLLSEQAKFDKREPSCDEFS